MPHKSEVPSTAGVITLAVMSERLRAAASVACTGELVLYLSNANIHQPEGTEHSEHMHFNSQSHVQWDTGRGPQLPYKGKATVISRKHTSRQKGGRRLETFDLSGRAQPRLYQNPSDASGTRYRKRGLWGTGVRRRDMGNQSRPGRRRGTANWSRYRDTGSFLQLCGIGFDSKNESLSQQLVSVIPDIAQDSTGDQLPDRRSDNITSSLPFYGHGLRLGPGGAEDRDYPEDHRLKLKVNKGDYL
ncbi:hypothetical protein EYF80_002464 [Liparis tanakae]|uniref:Uncharacterized protein n=1 Tax=Liparis tanakae TaxID=230148 RepID=A0A4Z2JDA5_9TELE|nr:hypothetical protein EYF80_002464 [Liparis tanakae]